MYATTSLRNNAVQILHLLTSILLHTVGLVFPLLGSAKNTVELDFFVGSISTAILIPIVHSFHTLTTDHLSQIFDRSKSFRQIDLRSDVLRMFQHVVDSFKSKKASVLGVMTSCRLHILVDTVHEMHRIRQWSHKRNQDNEDGTTMLKPSIPRHVRIRLLVEKDVFWYLIAISHCLLASSRIVDHTAITSDDLLMTGFLNQLISLTPMRDIVAQSMLYAVIERAIDQ